MNYTKGEWYVLQVRDDAPVVMRVIPNSFGGGEYIASCNTPIRPVKQNLANAHLIAAAPKLLKACEILANCGVVEGGRLVERIMPSSADILFAHEILAKAEG